MTKWIEFQRELAIQCDAIDPSSTSANKFDPLIEAISSYLNVTFEDIVVKYVGRAKNLFNRLFEAARRTPRIIVLFFDGSEERDLIERVQYTFRVVPRLDTVLILRRDSPSVSWMIESAFFPDFERIPPFLHEAIDAFDLYVLDSSVEDVGESQTLLPIDFPVSADEDKVRQSLDQLSETLWDDDAFALARTDCAETLGCFLGTTASEVNIKRVRSVKNLGNRLGEAISSSAGVIVLLIPDLLESRTHEEYGSWKKLHTPPLVIVSTGQEANVEVIGHEDAIVETLKALFERKTPASLEENDWLGWSYEQWSAALVRHYFKAGEYRKYTVERLAATPEELAHMVGESRDRSDEVTSAFVKTCVAKLPRGISFSRFCKGLDNHADLFGMLWFTCLVAYGYPDPEEGQFKARFDRVLHTSDNYRELPRIWELFSGWINARHEEAPNEWRAFRLPKKDEHRNVIGSSHFLAFPHALDRKRLSTVLAEEGLIGYEPPILPVVSCIRENLADFSSQFRKDFDSFTERFVEGSLDPRESAFWRAVRQETLEPSSLGRTATSQKTSILGLVAGNGVDVEFLPVLGCSADWRQPATWKLEPLDEPIEEWTHLVTDHEENHETVVKRVFRDGSHLGPGLRARLQQGVLIFGSVRPDEYHVVQGEELQDSEVAFVREDRVDAFVEQFGGEAFESIVIEGWYEIWHCAVTQLDTLPDGLSGVFQLQKTMRPPTIRFVKGTPVDGGFLSLPGCLPYIRATGASNVSVYFGQKTFSCTEQPRNIDDPDGPKEWVLPTEDSWFGENIELKVVADWPSPKRETSRTSSKTLKLFRTPTVHDYKPPAKGDYYQESCSPAERSIRGSDFVPMTLSAGDETSNFDVLAYEPSAKYLGTGYGELALEEGDRFEWLVVGPNNNPDFLIFSGDPDNPKSTRLACSRSKSDRRTWSKAFSKAKSGKCPVFVKTRLGEYRPLEREKAAYKELCRFASFQPNPQHVDSFEGIDIPAFDGPPRAGESPSSWSSKTCDALAALSVRRGGLKYATVANLMSQHIGSDDPLLLLNLISTYVECGIFDRLAEARRGTTLLVARRPRFVVVLRGPYIEASLFGLVHRALWKRVFSAAKKEGMDCFEISSPRGGYTPSLLRLRGGPEALARVSEHVGLESPVWFEWNNNEENAFVDMSIDAQAFSTDIPYGYERHASWCWGSSTFDKRPHPGRNGVRIERFRHPNAAPPLYVISKNETRWFGHFRNWALLHGHIEAGVAPFQLGIDGTLYSQGKSPIRLPLPLARFCTLLGTSLPGSLVSSRHEVEMHEYPFGRLLVPILEKIIPGTLIEHSRAL